MSFNQVDNLAIFERDCNEALASEHAVATEALVQDVEVPHAIQEGQDDGVADQPPARKKRSRLSRS